MKQRFHNRKVNEQAREVIASILLFEISDPRLSLVTITGCEVSYDRSVCNVFYTADPGATRRSPRPSRRRSGRIRSLMARSSPGAWRPSCASSWTRSVDEAERIASALARCERNRELPHAAEREAHRSGEEIERNSGSTAMTVTPQTNTHARALADACAGATTSSSAAM